MLSLGEPRNTNLRFPPDLRNDSGVPVWIAQREKTCCSEWMCFVWVKEGRLFLALCFKSNFYTVRILSCTTLGLSYFLIFFEWCDVKGFGCLDAMAGYFGLVRILISLKFLFKRVSCL